MGPSRERDQTSQEQVDSKGLWSVLQRCSTSFCSFLFLPLFMFCRAKRQREGRKERAMKIGKDARDDVASRTLFRATTLTLTVFGGRSTCPLTGRPFLSLVLFGGEEKMVTHSVA